MAEKSRSDRIEDYNHVSLLFPSDYITAADLRGRDVVVVLDKIEPRHELRRQSGKDYKPVVRLRGKDKAWVLNKTNANRIIEAVGSDETGDWEGWSITLYSCKVDYQGKRVDAIRIDPPGGAVRQPERIEAPDVDDIPF